MTRYDQDFYAWTQEQATLLKEKRFVELDINHLVEEIDDMGKSVQRELESRLIVLIAHLLKWYYQPDKRSHSWHAAILEQRKQIDRLLTKNPSLLPVVREEYLDMYELACLRAVQETNLDLATFPEQCPWTLEEILTDLNPR